MNYNKFAYIYDELMTDAPYSEWIEVTNHILAKYNKTPKKVVDLGCGTGSIAVPLAKSGFEVIGIDLSEDMLSIAYDKMLENNVSIQLSQQNMKNFELLEKVDLIVSYCDSLNYLKGEEEVRQAFSQAHKYLKPEGLFIFDMHSPYKLKHTFHDKTYAWNDEDLSVIWLTNVNNRLLTVEHDLSFFVQMEEGNLFEKFHEVHLQQTYTVEQVKGLLTDTGFELLDVFGDFQIHTLDEDAERIFYVARPIYAL